MRCLMISTRRRRSLRCTACATRRRPVASVNAAQFAASLGLLGFLLESAATWKGRKQQASGIDAAKVERLIADRTAARARKNFKESDRIRDELAAMGVDQGRQGCRRKPGPHGRSRDDKPDTPFQNTGAITSSSNGH